MDHEYFIPTYKLSLKAVAGRMIDADVGRVEELNVSVCAAIIDDGTNLVALTPNPLRPGMARAKRSSAQTNL